MLYTLCLQRIFHRLIFLMRVGWCGRVEHNTGTRPAFSVKVVPQIKRLTRPLLVGMVSTVVAGAELDLLRRK